MKRLCVFTLYNEKCGSSQYRAYIYKDMLSKHFDLKWFTFWGEKYVTIYRHNKKKYFLVIAILYIINTVKRVLQIVFVATHCDVVLFQKDCIPRVNCKNLLQLLKRNNIKIVFDIDDAVYLDRTDYSRIIASFSSTVMCGNETLQMYYSNYCDNCVIVPTVENANLYKMFWHNTYKNKIIGWIGSLSTVDNLEMVVYAINSIVEKHPEVEFRIISNDDGGIVNKIRNSKLIKWDINTYIKELSEFTIGIMPLYDSEHNRGKCGFKLIQYLNMHKPVVASEIGVNKNIVGDCGILAHNDQEWIEGIETLLFENNSYQKCNESIDEQFFKKYDYSVVAASILSILS